MKTITLLFAVFIGIQTAFANGESGRRAGAQAVYFNFMSYGTGIDAKSLGLAEELIEHANKKGQVLETIHKQYGREGETLLCVHLTNSFLPFQLVKSMAPSVLEDRQQILHVRTSVRIGADCSDYEVATEQNLESYINP